MLELITVQNTTIQLEVANPLALLYIAEQTCWFGKWLQATYEKVPYSDHSPWKLCIYEDGGVAADDVDGVDDDSDVGGDVEQQANVIAL